MIVVIPAQDAVRIALRIVVLVAVQRPEEGAKPDPPEHQRNRNQIGKDSHDLYRSLNALSDTVIDDADIAKAAMSGVASPRTASGIATAL